MKTQTKMMMTAAMLPLMFAGCVRTTSKVEVQPIHITLDVNLKVQKDLDDFFGDTAKPAPVPEDPKNAREVIQKRRSDRRPAIAQLKADGKIGEDNKGYLAVVSGTLADADAALINGENEDRKTVYTAIAKKQDTTPESVGQLRAVRNAERAKPGEYVMTQDGKWEKKK